MPLLVLERLADLEKRMKHLEDSLGSSVSPGSESPLREDGPRWKADANHRMLAALKTLVNAMDPNTNPDPRGIHELIRIGRAAIDNAIEWPE